MTTLDLTGKLTGPRCVIRLRTNMECYWDQAFIAVRDRRPRPVRVDDAPGRPGRLGHRATPARSRPTAGCRSSTTTTTSTPPRWPSWQASSPGTATSPAAPDDDDQLCLVGPGDEVRLEFDARRPPLPGWTRSYVLEVGLLQGRRPVHRRQRRRRAAPLAGDAGLPVRARGRAAPRPTPTRSISAST